MHGSRALWLADGGLEAGHDQWTGPGLPDRCAFPSDWEFGENSGGERVIGALGGCRQVHNLVGLGASVTSPRALCVSAGTGFVDWMR